MSIGAPASPAALELKETSSAPMTGPISSLHWLAILGADRASMSPFFAKSSLLNNSTAISPRFELTCPLPSPVGPPPSKF